VIAFPPLPQGEGWGEGLLQDVSSIDRKKIKASPHLTLSLWERG